MAGTQYFEHDKPIAFAHRGGAHEAPENTREAFNYAVDLGYRYIETDARLTSDGIPIAFHDSVIDRVSDQQGAVDEMTWDQLSQLVIHGSGHLMTIPELLAEFPETRFNIDAKTSDVIDPLLAAIEDAGALDRVCLASFFDTRVRRIRRIYGDAVATGCGPIEITALRLRGLIGRKSPDVACALQLPPTYKGVTIVNESLIALAKTNGRPIHVWTIDDADEMHRLLDLGVDGIMTDRPKVLKEVLESRGSW